MPSSSISKGFAGGTEKWDRIICRIDQGFSGYQIFLELLQSEMLGPVWNPLDI